VTTAAPSATQGSRESTPASDLAGNAGGASDSALDDDAVTDDDATADAAADDAAADDDVVASDDTAADDSAAADDDATTPDDDTAAPDDATATADDDTATGDDDTGGTTADDDTAAAGGAPDLGDDSPDPTVQLARPLQKMDGFGISFGFSSPLTNESADALFDPVSGIGLSIARVGMGDSGGPLSSKNWDDMLMAADRGVETFIGVPWSPPASMKTNDDTNDGGHLLVEDYEAWSDTIARFPVLVKDNTGIDLYGMSIQQEPDFASCGTEQPCNGNFPSALYTGEELANFAKVLGPKLHALTPAVKLISPDCSQWLHAWSNESSPDGTDPLEGMGYDYGHTLYADSEAWGQLDIFGVQQFKTQRAEPWPDDVPQTIPTWMTEMAGEKWFPEAGPSSDIEDGVVVAGWIHDALTVGQASAWLWRSYRAEFTDENAGLLLKDGTVAKRKWVLGNYSRFVRPGYVRVAFTGDVPEDVLPTAFLGPDGTVVIVVVNRGGQSAEVPILVAGGKAPTSLVPWLTSASADLAEGKVVVATEGRFTASLPAMSVTTFVGR
jgi:glucuronoarabinoxylan endo-1,4-beta-xylanase